MLVFAVLLFVGSPTRAQPAPGRSPPELPARELVIATKQTPPFAMKNADGQWYGISIELWRRIADQLHLRYRFQETDLKDLIDGVAAGRFDAGVAAVTISAPRELVVDFSQPYFTTGLGIAVPTARAGWWPVVRSTLSLGFIQVVLGLAGLLACSGLLIWLFERRGNHQFGGGPLKGIAAGFWWAAVTMTGVGYGDKVPTTVPGRLLAIAWMFISVVVISTFIAGIASALTTNDLTGLVQNLSDLRSARVGAVTGTTTTDYLSARQFRFVGFSNPASALQALQNGRIDAVVYDRSLLAWLIKPRFAETLRMLPLTFDTQSYGIALPVGSQLRRPVDRVLLEDVYSDWWRHLIFSYVGERM